MAAKYARENKIPIMGICFGFQAMVVEFARNVLGIKDASSREFMDDKFGAQKVVTDNPVIDIIDENSLLNLGGSMRIGSF